MVRTYVTDWKMWSHKLIHTQIAHMYNYSYLEDSGKCKVYGKIPTSCLKQCSQKQE